MEKIKKLKLSPIFEGKAIYEENGSKIQAISIGASIEIRKADGASALFIDAIAGEPVRYNKIEEKDLEIETLQNEFAGIVGQFDGQVHKLMAKYGYEWISPEDAATTTEPISTMEAVNENEGGDPTGTWIGDFLVTSVLSISKLVDMSVDYYDFSGNPDADEQKLENKFRQDIKKVFQDNLTLDDLDMDNLSDSLSAFVDNYQGELTEYADYYLG